MSQKELLSSEIVDGYLEIVIREPPKVKSPARLIFGYQEPQWFQDMSKPNVRVYKEIYGAVDGKVVLLQTKEGKYTPAHTVDEKIEFD